MRVCERVEVEAHATLCRSQRAGPALEVSDAAVATQRVLAGLGCDALSAEAGRVLRPIEGEARDECPDREREEREEPHRRQAGEAQHQPGDRDRSQCVPSGR
ncbi:MAG: hypothetical protein QOD65_49 [Gaiellales bacterium]|nr:hypothetical protein [Gaiellales bacterium]